jgi:hypothetical protein
MRFVLTPLVFLAAYCLLEATAPAQGSKELAEPRKPDDSGISQTSPALPASTSTVAGTEVSNETSNTELLRLMLRKIEDLESRIRDLEARQSHAQTMPAGPSATSGETATTTGDPSLPEQASGAEVAERVESPAATASGGAAKNSGGGTATQDSHQDMTMGTPRLQIQGFADVNFRATNEVGRTNSFFLGQLDLFITSRLSEKFSVLSELILEAGEDNAFTYEVHRLLLKYSHNDYFNLSAGRYHTSIGYYNTAYHHGSFFQTTANRPFLFAFESRGGILPLHNVGLSATGRIPSAPLGLRYVAEIGNGRASGSLLARPVQTAVDENNRKSYNLGVYARPSQVPGLQTGFSVYRDKLTPSGVPQVDQTIMAGHLVYQSALTEILNEAIVFRHSQAGRVFYIPGFYTQFSRRFRNWRPFFRYQYLNVPSDDPIYRAVGRRNGPSVGFRYDLSDFVNFKAQYDHTARRRLKAFDELILQLAFTF